MKQGPCYQINQSPACNIIAMRKYQMIYCGCPIQTLSTTTEHLKFWVSSQMYFCLFVCCYFYSNIFENCIGKDISATSTISSFVKNTNQYHCLSVCLSVCSWVCLFPVSYKPISPVSKKLWHVLLSWVILNIKKYIYTVVGMDHFIFHLLQQ